MKLFNFLKKGNRFIAAKDHRKNISEQVRLNRKTLRRLHQYDVENNSLLKLEFFFYTNQHDKLVKLASGLKQLNYRVDEIKQVEVDNTLWMLSGCTTNIRMDVATLNSWTTQMCKIGYDSDCIFDGWGTRPVQEAAIEMNYVQNAVVAARKALLTYANPTEQVKVVRE